MSILLFLRAVPHAGISLPAATTILNCPSDALLQEAHGACWKLHGALLSGDPFRLTFSGIKAFPSFILCDLSLQRFMKEAGIMHIFYTSAQFCYFRYIHANAGDKRNRSAMTGIWRG
ncbi:MAG: hypothetical protein JRN19_07000 [Nitrososphaerota archaeon]|nr:hypothetical protein [Nitrososphaerota archaeon]MDG7049483.1 hypothetical protein [Nitrososphaerota archaeon]MDG7052176.1 hypothetical protein [Nitrososphaerota archaeon]